MSIPVATRVAGVGLTVGDLDAACRFYERALGFQRLGSVHLRAAAAAARFGEAALSADCVHFGLGQQRIELVSFAPSGQPYPDAAQANDPWFQHFAVAVSDMDLAFAQISEHRATPVSRGGPQHLPPSTGSVVAYKFRDPEGHPLELSYIPASRWTEAPPAAGGPCLGIDHTALAVADLEASLHFYVGLLGMQVAARLINSGPEQDRLDGLSAVALDIVVLEAAERGGPHIELLAYRSPKPPERRAPAQVNDIAATRTVLAVDALEPFPARLSAAGRPVLNPQRRAEDTLLTVDPDGHLIELIAADPRS